MYGAISHWMRLKPIMKISKFKKLKRFNMESTTVKKSVETPIMKPSVLTIERFNRDWLKKIIITFDKA